MVHRSTCTVQNYKPLRRQKVENLGDLQQGVRVGHGDDLLDTTPDACSIKEVIDKLDVIKIENFRFAKDTIKR